MVAFFASATYLVLLTDGLLVAAVVLAGAGWGAWLTVALGFGQRSAAQQFCLAAGLGLGVLSTIALALGAAGLLNRTVCCALIGCGGILGVLRVYLAQSRTERPSGTNVPSTPAGNVALRCLVLLPLCIPLAVALFGATLPPGWLWSGEARGYDALEYHLEAPREYYEAGRIHFLPHNVYASFPQQAETLNLLLMHLSGSPLGGAIPAQLLHLAFGVLTVLALAAWAAPGWPRILVTLVAGAVPWLAYLGCLAYVELAMLFFAALAAGLVSESYRGDSAFRWQTALTAGLCAGLAGGCKYTALAMVGAALAVAWLLTMCAGLRVRLLRVALFGVGALAAFSPWLIRNAAFTGNPVYPFAYKWLGGSNWSDAQAEQWDRGHRPQGDKDCIAGRARLVVQELFETPLYGPALLLPIAAIALWPSRRQALLAIWLLLIIAIWALLTYVPGPLRRTDYRAAGTDAEHATSVASCGGPRPIRDPRARAGGGIRCRLERRGPPAPAARRQRPLVREDRRTPRADRRPARGLRAAPPGQRCPAGPGRLRLADRRRRRLLPDATHPLHTVVFNRDPWLELAESGATPQECLDWLHTRNVTHVVFSWSEINRLRTSYGFSPVATPEWVHQLEQAGLRRVGTPEGQPGSESVEIYEVATE